MLQKLILCAFVLLSLFATVLAASNPAHDADRLMTAYQQNTPIPLVSEWVKGLDLKSAYAIQKSYVKKRLQADQLGGFKAGLTSKGAQQHFGVKTPLSGLLFLSGKNQPGTLIRRTGFRKMMIETEIAFIVGTAITRPLQSPAALREKIRSVAPAIELPDLGFADLKKLKGTDLVAANVGAAQYILGDAMPVGEINLDQIKTRLSLNGKIINTGNSSDALGDPWKAALWLVNHVLAQGWTLEPGQVLLTGALGKMIPATPGNYSADYGPLGQISFEVR